MSLTITPYATNRYRYPTGLSLPTSLRLYDSPGLYLEIAPYATRKHPITISDPNSRSVRCYGLWTGTRQHSRCGVLFVWRRRCSCRPPSCAGPLRATSNFRGPSGAP